VSTINSYASEEQPEVWSEAVRSGRFPAVDLPLVAPVTPSKSEYERIVGEASPR